jgi:hypothetical protein
VILYQLQRITDIYSLYIKAIKDRGNERGAQEGNNVPEYNGTNTVRGQENESQLSIMIQQYCMMIGIL